MKNTMRATAISLAVLMSVAPVAAGTYVEPVIEPEIIVVDTVESAGSDDWVVPFMTLITIGMALIK